MEKAVADRIITEYVPKLYGFALSKTGDSREAEELASDITYEVYFSLLRATEVYNVNSYIWRIASYVFAHYVDRRRRVREQGETSVEDIDMQITQNGGGLPDALVDYDHPERLHLDADERAEHEEQLRRMRREIAYLGDTQRRIIVAHYYGGQSVGAISSSLGIPAGTVKWHLHDARKTIKEGMNMERNKGTLGVEPIKLIKLAHGGSPGTTGDTSDHLSTTLAQNIAYAAYDEPKTESEIADELGVSPLYLAEFIKDLEEYGFMTRLPGGKLRTDIVISRPTKDFTEALHRLNKWAAQEIGEKFMDRMIENIDAYMDAHRDGLYIPDGDRNLWRWSAFLMGSGNYLLKSMEAWDPETDKRINRFKYKRPDGGDYTAYAVLESQFDLDFDPDFYNQGGIMVRGSNNTSDGSSISAMQCSSVYDTRVFDWHDNKYEDYLLLYDCYTGNLPETNANIEKYRRLFERGLIVRRDAGISVNVPVMLSTLPAFDLFAGIDMEAYRAVIRTFGQRMAQIELPLYPKHMQDCIRATCETITDFNLIYSFEWMLENGYLTLPEDDRRGGLMTVVTAARLPGIDADVSSYL